MTQSYLSIVDGLMLAMIAISCQIAAVVLFCWLISRFCPVGASFRSCLWLAALTSAVLLPVLSLIYPYTRVNRLSVANIDWSSSTTQRWPTTRKSQSVVDPTSGPNRTIRHETSATIPTIDRSLFEPNGFSSEHDTSNDATRGILLPIEPVDSDRVTAETTRSAAATIGVLVLSTWLIGIGVLILRLSHGCIQLHQLRTHATPNDSQSAQRALNRALRNLGLTRSVGLMSSTRISGPVASDGFRGAMILMPPAMFAMPENRLTDVLTHEAAHILHRDVFLGLAQRLVRILYWPHPFVHLLVRELSRVREEICDNHVLLHGNVGAYAHTLVDLSTRSHPTRSTTPVCGMFDSATGLQRRIESLLEEKRDLMTAPRRFWFLAFALMFCFTSAFGVSSNGDDGRPNAGRESDGETEISVTSAGEANAPESGEDSQQDKTDADADAEAAAAIAPIRSRPVFAIALPANILDVTVSLNEELVAVVDDRAIATIAAASTGRTLLSFSVLLPGERDKLDAVQDNFAHSASLCFSPDGKTLAVACGPVIRLYDAETGNLRRSLRDVRLLDEWNSLGRDDVNQAEKLESIPHAHGHTYSIAYSPDGSLLASSGTHLIWPGGRSVINAELPTHGKLKIWDPQRGELLHDLGKHYETVREVAFAGQSLAAIGSWPEGWTMGVEIWDLAKAERSKTLAIRRGGGGDTVAVSPDGKWVAALATYSDPDPDQRLERLTRFQHLHLWDRTTGEMTQRLKMDRYVDAIAFSPDGATLAVGIAGDGVEFWDRETLKKRGTAAFGRKNVSDIRLQFGRGGKRLVGCANVNDRGILMLWKLDR